MLTHSFFNKIIGKYVIRLFMPSPILLNHLVKNYGKVQAVQDISFEMKEGEVLGLLGPNGAGKTSIISILTSLEKPTSGEAKIFGIDVALEEKQTKASLGFVPQELVSHGFFTVEEVLRFHSGYFGLADNKAQIDYLLNKLGIYIHKDKKIRELSGGMKRRFLIAKALVHRPKLLLLDEPTAGVDIELRNSLWEFVRELNNQGTSILLTTHYLEEAEKLCDRVAIIHLGKLRQMGKTAELVKNMTQRQIVFQLHTPTSSLQSPYVKSQSDKQIICQIPAGMELGELMGKIHLDTKVISDIRIKEGTLEEAFLNVLSEA